MKVRFNGKQSSTKYLPGGGPQGTLLGLFLFLVLINDAGFSGQVNNAGELLTSKRNMKEVNKIHLKYVDDLTLATSINLPEKLISVPDSERPLPDMYHARTGHVLPMAHSELVKQLKDTEEFATENQMKLNFQKTKLMLFNPCWSVDFMPEIELGNQQLVLVEEMRLLGVILRSDLKWYDNTEDIVKRASNKLWILRRLKALGANTDELIDMYIKHCRSILEFAAPVWNGAITNVEKLDIERTQKGALHIILGEQYGDYRNALNMTKLESLEARRTKLCVKFARKAEHNEKHQHWFKPKPKTNTRQADLKYWKPIARTSRLMDSPICYLTNLLNSHYKK